MADQQLLEPDLLREFLSAGGDWAKESGARLRKRREDLKLSLQSVATWSGTSVQTVFRIERGELVPRDYLRAGIAHAVMSEVGEIWTYPTRERLIEVAPNAEDAA